jgi:hypothetical protein
MDNCIFAYNSHYIIMAEKVSDPHPFNPDKKGSITLLFTIVFPIFGGAKKVLALFLQSGSILNGKGLSHTKLKRMKMVFAITVEGGPRK